MLSTAEFKQYAADNWVLVELDYPRRGDLPARQKELLKTYQVRGFPTIVLMDAQGKELGRTGYRRGLTPKKYIQHLDRFRK